MIRIVKLGSGVIEPWPEEAIEALRSAPRCFHLDPSHVSFSRLGLHGVTVLPAADEIPDDSVLIQPVDSLTELVYVLDRLLGPGGCPWDQAQTHESLKRHLLEECYEVIEAIDSGDKAKLREELGDLLMQPLMHAQMAARDGEFSSDDVAAGIVEKLVRRHPHVFDTLSVADADEVLRNWDKIKQAEKGGEPESIFAGVPRAMASLLRAYEISKRAVRVGFEWPSIDAVFDKLHEEEAELREALASGDQAHVESEIGDLLFTAVNLARWAKVEPEEALRKMLNRFTDRFMAMEASAPRPLEELSAREWDELWEQAKASSL